MARASLPTSSFISFYHLPFITASWSVVFSESKIEHTTGGQAKSEHGSGATDNGVTTPKTGESVESPSSKTGESYSRSSDPVTVSDSSRVEESGTNTDDGDKTIENNQPAEEPGRVVLGKDEVFCPGLGKPCPKATTTTTPVETVTGVTVQDVPNQFYKKVYFNCQKSGVKVDEDVPSHRSSAESEAPSEDEGSRASYSVIDDNLSPDPSPPDSSEETRDRSSDHSNDRSDDRGDARNNDHSSNNNEYQSQRTNEDVASHQGQEENEKEFRKEV